MIKNKQTLVHVIDNLGRGGAETMLVSFLRDLDDAYNVILVTLTDVQEFSEDEIICNKRYNLNYKSIKDLPKTVFKLRHIIKKHKPVLVRSELYWSTIISRLACPNKIKFVFSIHSQLSRDGFSKNKLALLLEKMTYKKRHSIISVSKIALDDYEKMINVRGKKFILHNFVNADFFKPSYDFSWEPGSIIKIVTVGNLKEAKNFGFLLNAIKVIKKNATLTLDI
ncbi:MAG: glycosyltransferase, partial [Ferruginibacter sp.]